MVGSVTFAFTPDAGGATASSARMSYVINASVAGDGSITPGFTQDKNIVRQGF
jgi:hypothetical protein